MIALLLVGCGLIVGGFVGLVATESLFKAAGWLQVLLKHNEVGLDNRLGDDTWRFIKYLGLAIGGLLSGIGAGVSYSYYGAAGMAALFLLLGGLGFPTIIGGLVFFTQLMVSGSIKVGQICEKLSDAFAALFKSKSK